MNSKGRILVINAVKTSGEIPKTILGGIWQNLLKQSKNEVPAGTPTRIAKRTPFGISEGAPAEIHGLVPEGFSWRMSNFALKRTSEVLEEFQELLLREPQK